MVDMCLFSEKPQRTYMYVLMARWTLCVVFAFLLCKFSTHAHAQSDHTGVNMPTSLQNRSVLVAPTHTSPKNISWLCYYGADRSVLSLPNYTLLILEANALGPLTQKEKAGRVCIAYMSIGEIVQSRWFWPDVQDKTWLLEENPDWTGARRIDPRSSEWADLLVHKVAPALLAAGYDGFLLDNVDVGEYLENTDPVRYEGASMAVAEIIHRLRTSYPDAVIIANGGLSTAAEVTGCLSAVMCESTFSTWVSNEDGTFSYAEISPQSKAWLRPRLLRIRGADIPILALEYVNPHNTEEQQRVREAVKKAGHHPYIAERSLMQLPNSAHLPPPQ